MSHPLEPTIGGRPLRLVVAAALGVLTGHLVNSSSFQFTTWFHIAFLAAGGGALIAIVTLRSDRWLLAQERSGPRAARELAWLGLWATLPAAGLLAGVGELASDLGLVTSLLAAALHLTALAFLILRSPLPVRLTPLALVAALWWVPALLPSTSSLLSPSRRLAPLGAPPDTCASLASVGALILAALLLPRFRGSMR